MSKQIQFYISKINSSFIRANSEIERLRRLHSSETEGVQTQLRFAQLRVQSLEQELKSIKQELEQKVYLIQSNN